MTAEAREGALAVLTLLDLSEGIAPPWAAQLFAQYGARVIKVERPVTGDVSRSWGCFEAVNAGKLGLTLDYETPEGAAVLRRLAEDADGLIEDQPSRRRAGLGLGAEELIARIPRLVIAQVSALGEGGPSSGRPLTGITLAAASGRLLLHAQGAVDDRGAERSLGLHTFVATLAGLWHAAQTEHGQVIEIPGMEALVSTLGAPLAAELAESKTTTRSTKPGSSTFQLGRTPAATLDPAPGLGEHTDYVLHDLIGLDATEIEALRAKGVV